MIALNLLASIALAATSTPSDATTFRGNPEHTGVYESGGKPMFTKIKWKFKTNGKIASSPAVANGTVFVGSWDHNLYAINEANGTLKWKFAAGSRVASSPAVANGLIYVVSYDGFLYAVDALSGKQKWKFETKGERRFAAPHIHGVEPKGETMPDPFDFYLSSPVVVDGVVYFGSGDANVYALDAATGEEKWRFKTGDVVHASPAVSGGILYVGSWDSYFYALNTKTGKQKWRFKTGEDKEIYNQVGIQGSAAVVDGIVYFGCRDSNFYALNANSGEKVWSYPNHGSWVIGSPALKAGTVYFTTADSALFHALDAKTGAEVFSLKYKWPMFSSPSISGDTLYVGSHEGKIFTVDLAGGKKGWEFQTDGSKANLAKYSDKDGGTNYGAAFFDGFYDSIIEGVDKLMSVGAILSSPVIANDTVYFGSMDGNVYALK